MPLNLENFTTFAKKLNIRDRDTGIMIPFKLRQQQYEVIEMAKEHLARKRRLYMIFLKARRVGLSTLATALGHAHCVAFSSAQAGTVAQNREVAVANFAMACGFVEDMASVYGKGMLRPTSKTLTYPHDEGRPSTFKHYTAATVHGARGLTFSSLHLTEAAFYPYEGAFTSLMNTLSKDPNNQCLIETTANGMEGPGESYYQYWTAAVEGDNEFLPIFLPWYDDPSYVMDPARAKDAPRDEYERWLMNDIKHWRTGKKVKIGKDRIAWFRETLSAKCEGVIEAWREEYPSTPEEAFVATGNPAFTVEEMQFAEQSITPAPFRGRCVLELSRKSGILEKDMDGPLEVWESPQPGHHYFAGVDSARGEEASLTAGDYASIFVWNAETGAAAARFMARVSPEQLAEIAAALGFYFNGAMLNVELNNLGYVVMRELRDKIYYPSQYLWKGRDDRADKSRTGMAYGFETSDRYRRMMFTLFRTALHRKEVLPKDRILVQQMRAAKLEMNFRWTVRIGHDDVLMAAFLAWIAKEQYHPDVCRVRSQKNLLLPKEDFEATNLPKEAPGKMPEWSRDGFVTALGGLLQTGNDHLRKLQVYDKRKNMPERLAGV
jgi:hypothetical protein